MNFQVTHIFHNATDTSKFLKPKNVNFNIVMDLMDQCYQKHCSLFLPCPYE